MGYAFLLLTLWLIMSCSDEEVWQRRCMAKKVCIVMDDKIAQANHAASLLQCLPIFVRFLRTDRAFESVNLLQIATRQKLHNEVDDDNLSRAFQGGVTLTFKEVETITLEPSQVHIPPLKNPFPCPHICLPILVSNTFHLLLCLLCFTDVSICCWQIFCKRIL